MRWIINIVAMLLIPFGVSAQTPDTVFLEELTWTEVRNAIDNGTTTIIIPTGGTEQNGPHMVLGKHNYRITAASERIARELGDALVAPVMTYVPEGEIDPPSGHMRFAGTISVPHEVFKSVLEYAARSLKVHGFTDILLIGESGPNRPGMEQVSEKLNKEWASEKARVLFISSWYSSDEFKEWLLLKGETEDTLGEHAGLMDTATLLAIAPEHVRTDIMSVARGMDIDGATRDPTRATVEIGKMGLEFKYRAVIQQICQLMTQE